MLLNGVPVYCENANSLEIFVYILMHVAQSLFAKQMY
jgi:hypothetical protein